jgi:putative tryptophan/tyrosine transport system substrate-binding protein
MWSVFIYGNRPVWITMKLLKRGIIDVVACIVVASVALALPTPACSSGLVILYPEARKPYARIYEDIIIGIEESYQQRTLAIAITGNEALSSYKASIGQFAPDKIIVLGQRSLTLARQLDLKVPVLAGAITHPEVRAAGISMVPDSRLIIDKLQLLYGKVRNIHLVTNTSGRENQYDSAIAYGKSKGINLIIHNVRTVQDAAGAYRKILADVDADDAIWLDRDEALHDSAVFSQILETTWKQKIAVFSSNPTHVKRGALFAVYPHNKKLGTSLGKLAKNTKPGIEMPLILAPLQDVYTIVNGRTSRHLGITMSKEIRNEVDNVL